MKLAFIALYQNYIAQSRGDLYLQRGFNLQTLRGLSRVLSKIGRYNKGGFVSADAPTLKSIIRM
jgi:hypothetical protein